MQLNYDHTLCHSDAIIYNAWALSLCLNAIDLNTAKSDLAFENNGRSYRWRCSLLLFQPSKGTAGLIHDIPICRNIKIHSCKMNIQRDHRAVPEGIFTPVIFTSIPQKVQSTSALLKFADCRFFFVPLNNPLSTICSPCIFES